MRATLAMVLISQSDFWVVPGTDIPVLRTVAFENFLPSPLRTISRRPPSLVATVSDISRSLP